MNLPMFKAVLEGYQEHLFDLKCLTVHAGYWAAYYSNTKRPKSLGTVLNQLFEEHKKAKKRKSINKQETRPEVDVEKFLQREHDFRARMQRR